MQSREPLELLEYRELLELLEYRELLELLEYRELLELLENRELLELLEYRELLEQLEYRDMVLSEQEHMIQLAPQTPQYQPWQEQQRCRDSQYRVGQCRDTQCKDTDCQHSLHNREGHHHTHQPGQDHGKDTQHSLQGQPAAWHPWQGLQTVRWGEQQQSSCCCWLCDA